MSVGCDALPEAKGEQLGLSDEALGFDKGLLDGSTLDKKLRLAEEKALGRSLGVAMLHKDW